MPGPLIHILELKAQGTCRKGDLTFFQRERVVLAQARTILDIGIDYLIRRDPSWAKTLNCRLVLKDTDGRSVFGFAGHSDEPATMFPFENSQLFADELENLFRVLADPAASSARDLLRDGFPHIADPQQVAALVATREALCKRLGGKHVETDLQVLVSGRFVAEFKGSFPRAPKLESEPEHTTLAGHIAKLGWTTIEFQDNARGKINVDFSADLFFYPLRTRFSNPPLPLVLGAGVTGEGTAARYALDQIVHPVLGTFSGENLVL